MHYDLLEGNPLTFRQKIGFSTSLKDNAIVWFGQLSFSS